MKRSIETATDLINALTEAEGDTWSARMEWLIEQKAIHPDEYVAYRTFGRKLDRDFEEVVAGSPIRRGAAAMNRAGHG